MRYHGATHLVIDCEDESCEEPHMHVLSDDELAIVKAEKFWAGYKQAKRDVVDIGSTHVRD